MSSSKQTTKVIVNGARGKMGTIACATIERHPDFVLAAAVTRDDNLAEIILTTKAQIVIDLTSADCVYANSLIIISNGAHPIIGTSGLLTKQIAVLKQKCMKKKLGGIIVPNFSLSAILMMQFATEAARILPAVEIIEAHHAQKIDAPSATARKTAEMIAKAQKITRSNLTTTPTNYPASRGELIDGIHIHSLRLPGVLATQQVIFGNNGETLTISHASIDRTCFMPGLILACQRVQQLNSLYYGLEYLLKPPL